MASDDERELMGRAIEVAATARRRVSPRPWVGAVVRTADGAVHAGATDGRTGPHAEVVALDLAGDDAKGATLVVTLEPCAHVGRTGPCADAVIAAGIERCVVGITDPDPRVAGEGIARLRAAGVDVEVGVRADDVRRRTGRAAGSPAPRPGPTPTASGPTATPCWSARAPSAPTIRR
jgi:diaminohydroxyphosphoribosylaminopyrimidine deaminase/5-amino-6-(5-phosphoribosylamino)uracil reductase